MTLLLSTCKSRLQGSLRTLNSLLLLLSCLGITGAWAVQPETGNVLTPRTLNTQPLAMRGLTLEVRTIGTGPLEMRGMGHSPHTVHTAPLVMRGLMLEPRTVATTPLAMRGLTFFEPRTIGTAPLIMRGLGFEPRNINTPMLLMRGQSHTPRSIHTQPLVMRGLAVEPRSIQTQPLLMRGLASPPRTIATAPLQMRGLRMVPRTVGTGPLTMRGVAQTRHRVDIRSMARYRLGFQPRTISTAPFNMRGLRNQPRRISTAPLTMRGLAFQPRSLHTPALTMRGLVFEPRTIGTGPLQMQGVGFTPRTIYTGGLQMQGITFEPRTIATAPLTMRGLTFEPRIIGTAPLTMRGLGFNPRTINTGPLSMRGWRFVPQTINTQPLAMRGLRHDPRNIFTGPLTMRGMPGRMEQPVTGGHVDNEVPADVRSKIILTVPVRLQRLHRNVISAKVSCFLGDKHTGQGETNLELEGNGLMAVVEVPIHYERDASYLRAPNFRCQLSLRGSIGDRQAWLVPSLHAANYRVPSWGQPLGNFRNRTHGTVSDMQRAFPNPYTVHLRVEDALYMTGKGKDYANKGDLAAQEKQAQPKVTPKAARTEKATTTAIHDFRLQRIIPLSSRASQTNPFEFADLKQDIEEAQTPDNDPGGPPAGPVALTVDSALPIVTVASNGEVAIDANGANVLSAGVTGTFSAANVAIKITSSYLGDQENFLAGNNWSMISRTHANPISDTVTPSFVVRRNSAGDYYKITIGFDAYGASGVDFDITSLSGFNCGASAGDCP